MASVLMQTGSDSKIIQDICTDSCLTCAHEIICIFGISMAFEVHIYFWHIFCNSIWRTCCRLLFFGLVWTVMWGLYVITVLVQWVIYIQCHRHICSGAYASNLKHVYLCSWSHCWLCWVHRRDIYWHRCLMSTWSNWHIPGMWHMRGHISFWHVNVTFLSHNADSAINVRIAFLLLRWLFRGSIWLCASASTLLAAVSCATDNAIGIMYYWCQ